MSDLEKFVARVKQLNEREVRETSFDVPFLVRVIKEMDNLSSPEPETVVYTGGKFND
jgi:hypothetical protein|tara:strand:+ start:49 stop:219 length:171 start_codon:yes stop_codon:yes gene_type:complete